MGNLLVQKMGHLLTIRKRRGSNVPLCKIRAPDLTKDSPEMKVPFLKPSIEEEDIERMNASIRSGWLTYGPYTREFERKLAAFANMPHVVMTASCTASLHISLMLANVGRGDEVITTPLSWVATANVILYQGAKVVFAEVDPKTGNLDPVDVERRITHRTKAIIVVHLYGVMADMKSFEALSKKYGLAIIEDAAHAIESSRDGLRPGHVGLSACYSFHVAKNITAAQGGAIALHDEGHEQAVRMFRRHGVRNTEDGKRRMLSLGYKYEGSDLQAALLLGQLARIDSTHQARLRIFTRYLEAFRTCPGIRFPEVPHGAGHSGHMFIVWVDPAKRDTIRAGLARNGIETSIHFDAIHLEPYYRNEFGYSDGDFPVAERLGRATISLPTYPSLTDQEQQHVIDSLCRLVKGKDDR